MDWESEGYIVSVKPHGETSAIVNVFTPDKGLHAGLVRGGRSRRLRPILQAGNKVSVEWRARLSEHLGIFTLEAINTNAAFIMESRSSLAGLNSVCSLLVNTLAERETHANLYQGFEVLLKNFTDIDIWPALYIRFEIALLNALGYGLDFSTCAATGTNDNLTHVSPRSGRAVSASAAEPYLDKLMILPAFLNGGTSVEMDDLANGFRLSEYFLATRIFHAINKDIPAARSRLVEELKTVGIL